VEGTEFELLQQLSNFLDLGSLSCIQPTNLKTCYRIGIDEWLRVPSVEDVFAIGDCAGFLEQTGKPVLPALAQVSIIS